MKAVQGKAVLNQILRDTADLVLDDVFTTEKERFGCGEHRRVGELFPRSRVERHRRERLSAPRHAAELPLPLDRRTRHEPNGWASFYNT